MSFIDKQKISQKNHFLCWNGDIANDLLLVAVQGSESLSSPFRYEIRSLTKLSEAQLSRLHGKGVSCKIGSGDYMLPQRFLHGVVTRIRYVQHTSEEAECILTLEPSLALLKMGRMMCIWQNISVPDLVRTLLSNQGITQVDLQLQGSYPKREYCMQYRESAFDFIQRLLDEEGIYYFFRHSESGHTLVLVDHSTNHKAIKGNSLVWHHHGSILTQGSIDSWASTASMLPAAVELQGINMQQAAAVNVRQTSRGADTHTGSIAFIDITPQGERSLISHEAQQVMAACEANTHLFDATVNAHWLGCGETFLLTGHPSDNGSYRIQTLTFDSVNNFDNNNSNYRCQIQSMSNDQPWAPPYPHLRPEISGVLTAIVVGPSSEEIYTDEYGRIKIQFLWDKENPHDDTSSCWVRVSQPWAGAKFGAQFIPRVGSEVVVSFLYGHPDYPLVTGMLYNGQNKPPFALPAEKNESGFVTRTMTDGSIDDGHRLSFNDKKGNELLSIVAQKDLALTVKNDVTSTIAANRTTELSKGNDQLILKEGDMNVILEKGNWDQNITGNYTLKVIDGSGSITTDKSLTLESTKSIELKVGDSKISLSVSGISISGKGIKIEASGTLEVEGATTTISANGNTKISGEMIYIG